MGYFNNLGKHEIKKTYYPFFEYPITNKEYPSACIPLIAGHPDHLGAY